MDREDKIFESFSWVCKYYEKSNLLTDRVINMNVFVVFFHIPANAPCAYNLYMLVMNSVSALCLQYYTSYIYDSFIPRVHHITEYNRRQESLVISL